MWDGWSTPSFAELLLTDGKAVTGMQKGGKRRHCEEITFHRARGKLYCCRWGSHGTQIRGEWGYDNQA
jgi:hypothetical protein